MTWLKIYQQEWWEEFSVEISLSVLMTVQTMKVICPVVFLPTKRKKEKKKRNLQYSVGTLILSQGWTFVPSGYCLLCTQAAWSFSNQIWKVQRPRLTMVQRPESSNTDREQKTRNPLWLLFGDTIQNRNTLTI